MTKQTRVIVIVGAAVAALLVATIVVGVVILNTLRSQAENQSYQDCMARYGHAVDAPAPDVAEDDMRAYTEDLVKAANACMAD